MDAPPGGSGFGGREKVCGEAEGEVQSWERRSQHWGLLNGGGGVTRGWTRQSLPSQSPGPCLPAGADAGQTHPGLPRWSWWGSPPDSAPRTAAWAPGP